MRLLMILTYLIYNSESFQISLDHWNMPPNRSPRTVHNHRDWLIPPSRNPSDLNEKEDTEFKLEKELNTLFKESFSTRANVTEEMKGKIDLIMDKFGEDIVVALENSSTKVGEKHDEPPGFFYSFQLVKTFLESLIDSLNYYQSANFSPEFVSHRKNEGLKSKQGSQRTTSIKLNSYGVVGDITNDVMNSFIYAITIWNFRNEDLDCSKKLICQANREIFGRGHIIPSILTVGLTNFLSLLLEDESILKAAVGGRNADDCKALYSFCEMEL